MRQRKDSRTADSNVAHRKWSNFKISIEIPAEGHCKNCGTVILAKKKVEIDFNFWQNEVLSNLECVADTEELGS
jgi:hypothetical protein